MVQDDVMSISVGKYLVNWVNDLAFLITLWIYQLRKTIKDPLEISFAILTDFLQITFYSPEIIRKPTVWFFNDFRQIEVK